jgi:hypothetical protein
MKIVKENINFERGGENPLFTMGVGKKELISRWLDKVGVENYFIDEDFSIDADYVDLENQKLGNFPEYIQFRDINGSFDCAGNDLTTLRGCPKYVGGSFECHHNVKTFAKWEVLERCK